MELFGYVPEQVIGYTCSILQGAETEQDKLNALMNNISVSFITFFLFTFLFIMHFFVAESSLFSYCYELHDRQAKVQELDSNLSAVCGRPRVPLSGCTGADCGPVFHVPPAQHCCRVGRRRCNSRRSCYCIHPRRTHPPPYGIAGRVQEQRGHRHQRHGRPDPTPRGIESVERGSEQRLRVLVGFSEQQRHQG